MRRRVKNVKPMLALPAFWFALGVPVIFLLIVLLPDARAVFLDWTARLPYPLSFIKFALLATVGEILALRMTTGCFRFPRAAVGKAIVWGVIGMLIAALFPVYTSGVGQAQTMGLLPGAGSLIVTACLASVLLNYTFGIVMMGAHRITDTWLERRADGRSHEALLASIDWPRFIRVVVLQSIPFFWVPAHTVTFLLPEGFRVIWSALLSIALGVILSLAPRRQT